MKPSLYRVSVYRDPTLAGPLSTLVLANTIGEALELGTAGLTRDMNGRAPRSVSATNLTRARKSQAPVSSPGQRETGSSAAESTGAPSPSNADRAAGVVLCACGCGHELGIKETCAFMDGKMFARGHQPRRTRT